MCSSQIQHAHAQFRKGDTAGVIDTCKNVLQSEPENRDALNLAGAAALQLKRVGEAIDFFRGGVAAHPQDAELHNNLGAALLQAEELEPARDAFAAAVRLRADYAEARKNFALSLFRLGRQQLAAEQISAVESTARSLVEHEPNDPDGWSLLGISIARQNRASESVECFRHALEYGNESPDVLANLGAALVESGHVDEGLSQLTRSVELAPNSSRLRTQLATGLREAGQLDEAVMEATRATELSPEDVDAWRNLALCHERLRQMEEASLAYQRVTEMHPEDPDGWFGRARVAQRQGEVLQAIQFCEQTLTEKPDSSEAHFLLGQLLRQSRRLERQYGVDLRNARRMLGGSLDHLRKAIALSPTPQTFDALGQTYLALNQHIEAKRCFREAIQLQPDFAPAHDNLGNVELELGETDAAVESFEKTVQIDTSFARAWFHLVRSRTSPAPEVEIRQLKSLIDESPQSSPQQAMLWFAIARLYDQLTDYDAAFATYESGNALKPRPDDSAEHPEMLEAMVSRLAEVFTTEFFDMRLGWGDKSWQPIFVVGVPRSGTTLTEQVISSHPDVHGAGELPDIGSFRRRIAEASSRPYPEATLDAQGSQFAELAEEYASYTSSLSDGKRRIVDKMPGNFFHLGLIAVLFPQATIIHCHRDPRDTCVSCFRNSLDWPFCDLRELGRFYQRYRRVMSHWRGNLPLKIHDVRYEDVVVNFEASARKLIDACDLEWNDRCLRYYENPKAVGTPSKWQVRQPIYTSSVDVWRRYEKHLTPLLEEFDKCIDE